MSRSLLFCLALLSAWSGLLHANPLAIYAPAPLQREKSWAVVASTQAFLADDPVPVRTFFNDWSGSYRPRNGKNLALGMARIETGLAYQDWKVAYFRRLDLILDANRDATDLIHASKQRTDLPLGRQYDMRLGIHGFEADGIQIGKAFHLEPLPDLSITAGVGASFLRGIRLQEGALQGQATASTPKTYDFNANLDYSYSRNYLYALPVNVSHGWGYTFDTSLRALWRNRFLAEFTANDLLGALYWTQAPYTLAQANSSNKSTDKEGYTVYAPMISGLESSRDLTQRLTPKWRVRFTWQDRRIQPFFAASGTAGYLFPQFGATLPLGAWRILGDYETRFRTVGVKLNHPYFHLGLRTDSIHLGQAHALGLEIGGRLAF